MTVIEEMEKEAALKILGIYGGCNVVEKEVENDEDGFSMDVDPREDELKTETRPRKTTPIRIQNIIQFTENHLKHNYFKFGNDSIGSTCPSHITFEM